MRVWKKALCCVSVTGWRWEYAIVEMECDAAAVVGLDVGKCRAPAVTVIAIHPYTAREHDPDPGDTARDDAMTAYRASGDETAHLEPDHWSGPWYGRHNFSGLADGDVVSWYDHGTRWRVGETVLPHRWDPDPELRCGPGIHCFRSRLEAEDHRL